MERLLAILLVTCTACATVAGRTQIVGIDSNPRGVTVRSEATGEPLGTTPFFTRIERTHYLDVQLDEAGKPRPERVECHWRYADSTLGSVIPALAGAGYGTIPAAVFAGVSNLTDIASGAGWSCEPIITLPVPESAKAQALTVPEPCPRIAIAPPAIDDEAAERQVVEAFRERTKKTCATLIDEKLEREVFSRHGITRFNGLEIPLTSRSDLNAIGFESGATHVAVLAVEKSRTHVEIRPALYDLFTLAKNDLGVLHVDVPQQTIEHRTLVGAVAGGLRIVPTAGLVGVGLRQPHYTGNNGAEVVNVERTRRDTGIPVGFGVILLEPESLARRPWEVIPRVTMSLVLISDNRLLTIRQASGTQVERQSDVLLGGLQLGPQLFIPSPIGTFTASAGVVGAVTNQSEPGGASETGFDAGLGATASFNRFVGQRVFLRLGVSYNWFFTPVVERPEYRLKSALSPSLSLGYYFPEVRDYLRGLFL